MTRPSATNPPAAPSPLSAPSAQVDIDGGVYAHAPADVRAEMSVHRASIDNIDTALMHLLAERFKHTGAVGQLKAEYDLAVSDLAREDAQALRMRALAEGSGLDPDFAERFIRFLIAEVLEKHRAIPR